MVPKLQQFTNGTGPLIYQTTQSVHPPAYHVPLYTESGPNSMNHTIYQHHRNIARVLDTSKHTKREKKQYYVNTAHLLYAYSNKRTICSAESTTDTKPVLSFTQRNYVLTDRSDIAEQYKRCINPSYIRPTRPKPETQHTCPECKTANRTLIVQLMDSTMQCMECGFCYYEPVLSSTPSYKYTRTARPTITLYKRINHFNDWLSQFQAKENMIIPDVVYANIIREMTKQRQSDITTARLRRLLRKLKLNKYYEHIPRIMHRLQGTSPPKISRHIENQMRCMFRQIQDSFMRHSPKSRKNFLSYSFVLRKFVRLLGLNNLVSHFPLLKSRSKLYQQDVIWRHICADMGWRFDPSM